MISILINATTRRKYMGIAEILMKRFIMGVYEAGA